MTTQTECISFIERVTKLDAADAVQVVLFFSRLKDKYTSADMKELAGLLQLMADWDGKTFWNYEPALARRCIVRVGKAPRPTWWCASLKGQNVSAVEVQCPQGERFLIFNEDDLGYQKCLDGGGPDLAHRSLPKDSTVIYYTTKLGLD